MTDHLGLKQQRLFDKIVDHKLPNNHLSILVGSGQSGSGNRNMAGITAGYHGNVKAKSL